MAVYKIVNPIGKIYIGSSVHVKGRYAFHKGYHCKQQPKLHRSLIEYGFEKHSFEILEVCTDEQTLRMRESYYGNLYNCLGDNGLNGMLPFVDKSIDCVSQETRKKQSESIKGENNPFYGKQHSSEVLKYLSDVNTGDKNPFYGKKHTEETLALLRNNNHGNRPVLNIETGIYYDSITDAATSIGISYYAFKYKFREKKIVNFIKV